MLARSGPRYRPRPASASDRAMTPVFGLYSHIRSNLIRSGVLMFALVAVSVPVAFGLAMVWTGLHAFAPSGSDGPRLDELFDLARINAHAFAPWFLGGMIAWVILAMSFARKLIDGASGAVALPAERHAYVLSLVEPLCISRGMSTPVLNLLDDSAPNAFASGFDKDNAAITLTTGLLDLLDRDELECVLAHELTHIRNADVTLMFTATVIGGWIEFWGDLLRQNLNAAVNLAFSQRREKQSAAGVVILALGAMIMIIAAILSRMFRLAISRRREFLADAGAVELTKNPDALIRALLKLETSAKLDQMPTAIQQMCFCNPVEGFLGLFSTHPPVADRVEALVQYAGGRLPQSALEPIDQEAAAGPWGQRLNKTA